jgi:predicted transposase YdaD
LWNWLKFFSARNREEFEALAKEDQTMAEAYGTLMELSADEQTRLLAKSYEKREMDERSRLVDAVARGKAEGRAEGKTEGKAEGEAEGEAKKTYAFVRNALRQNLSLPVIAELTDLSLEEVKRLAAEIGK